MKTRHAAITITHDRPPFVDVVYAGAPTVEDLEDAFAEYGRIAALRQPVLWLIDMTEFDPLQVSAASRREGARIFERYAVRLHSVSIAEARVITSPLTRGIVTAFDWLTSKNKWPCNQFATAKQAEAWLLSRFEAAGQGSSRP